MNFFLIHGAYGHSEENWFPWLKNKLEKLGHTVYVPKFPTPKGQTLENWMKVFDEYIHLVDENTVFIGHSLGPAFILSVVSLLEIESPFIYLKLWIKKNRQDKPLFFIVKYRSDQGEYI